MKPILIIGYKRLTEFENLIFSVIECQPERIYVALDFVDEDLSGFYRESFREIITRAKLASPRIEINVWQRDRNLGSALSVMSAIDWAFKSEDELIILEDDLIISPLLIEYFDKCLDQLNYSQDVFMISGTNPFSTITQASEYGIAHYPLVWGWATNREKWIQIRYGILESSAFTNRRVNRRTRNFLETGRIRAQSMKIDAWDVPLSAYMAATGKKCFIPKWNLVSNIGSGVNATHTLANQWPLNLKIDTISDEALLGVSLTSGEQFDYSSFIESYIYKIRARNYLSLIRLRVNNFVSRDKLNTRTLANHLEKIVPPAKDIK